MMTMTVMLADVAALVGTADVVLGSADLQCVIHAVHWHQQQHQQEHQCKVQPLPSTVLDSNSVYI